MTPGESERAGRFRNDADRQRFTIGRALARRAVAARRGCSEREVAISVDEAGKPWLAPGAEPASLSIAHGGDLVAVALAGRGALGVDVESSTQAIDLDAVLPLVCSDREQQAIASLPAATRLHRFLLFWTLKEAFLKATGLGLGGDAAQVVFDLADPRAPVLLAAPGNGGPDGAAWRFLLVPDLDGHVLALAFRPEAPGDGAAAPQLRDAGALLAAGHGAP